MAIKRMVFVKAGVVEELSMCDEDYADEWCTIKGYDAWAVADIGPADPIREVEPGDELTAPSAAAPGRVRALNPALATAKRGPHTFVNNGVRDIAKVLSASAVARMRPGETP